MALLRRLATVLSGLAVVASMAACGGGVAAGTLNGLQPAPIDTADHVKPFVSASAGAMYGLSILESAIPGLQIGTNPPPSCPVITQSGDTMTVRGDCTDANGKQWFGTVTRQGGDGATETSTTFNGWGSDGAVSCMGMMGQSHSRTNGTIRASGASGSNTVTFDLDLTIESSGLDETSCMMVDSTIAMQYHGTAATNGSATTYNGSGRLGFSSVGVVDASTTDEVIDGTVCHDPASMGNSPSEPLSGTTTLRSGSNTAVITYDGATNCDPAGTVTWTYNGTSQGELAGVRCNVSRRVGQRGTIAFAGLAFVALAVARSRRRKA
jgi:hypothetical protein